MQGNPYESPTAVDGPPTVRTHGLRFIGTGLLGGVSVGATFGAIQGAVLAVILVVAAMFEGDTMAINATVIAILAMTILGTLAGCAVGGAIGSALGTITVLMGSGSFRLLIVVGVTASTFCAVIANTVAIRVTAPNPTTIAYAAAIASGIANGFFGGLVLVRGLIRLAKLGHPSRPIDAAKSHSGPT